MHLMLRARNIRHSIVFPPSRLLYHAAGRRQERFHWYAIDADRGGRFYHNVGEYSLNGNLIPICPNYYYYGASICKTTRRQQHRSKRRRRRTTMTFDIVEWGLSVCLGNNRHLHLEGLGRPLRSLLIKTRMFHPAFKALYVYLHSSSKSVKF